MPAKPKMTWDRRNRRWRKLYKGQRYVVSCRQLDAPETKEESYQKANDWWIAKQTEIDGHEPPHRYAEHLELLRRRREWARVHDLSEELRFITQEIERIEKGRHPNVFDVTFLPQSNEEWADYTNTAAEIQRKYPDRAVDLYKATDPFDAAWNDRLSREPLRALSDDRSVGSQVERYVSLERERAEASVISYSEYDLIRLCMGYFRQWLGVDSAIDRINADVWEDYWRHLSKRTVLPGGSTCPPAPRRGP
jgi:hypothetical protein